ncbi:MAG: glycerol kinase GlpK [Alphaproteobacteria bacterium]|nr:glycerol kinase GlpK [Alphaproteobacteria bacterium]
MAQTTGILAIDQGTTSSRAIVFDTKGQIISVAQQEFRQIYPADGWVEHDPEEIWQTTLSSIQAALTSAREKDVAVAAAGITNQRETTVVWDRKTGEPIHNAIVWQDRRTAEMCRRLESPDVLDMLAQRTGLIMDPYFSATKIAWLLDEVEGARARAERGELAFGTIDSFLIWRLTQGQVHATDATNASRTNLYNIATGKWDTDLLGLFGVPASLMPEVKNSADDFGEIAADLIGAPLPLLGVAGDQQAATVGQACFEPGAIKSTYGTGCFVVMNTGTEIVRSQNRLLSTIAYQIAGQPTYALEGSIFVAGAAVQWLRDQLAIIDSAAQTEELIRSLGAHPGVYMVPAFAGLGAPHWNPDARGALFGMTRGTGAAELSAAAVEAAAYQTYDLLQAAIGDGVNPSAIRVDGGMVANDWFCAFLADILGIAVDRPEVMETTALGAAYLAGLQAELFSSLEEIAAAWHCETRFEPKMEPEKRTRLLGGWERAVKATLLFAGD